MVRAGLESIPKSKRWTEAEARKVLGALERSGLAVTRFAAQHGVSAERLYQWRRRLERERASASGSPRFTEVRVALPSSAAIELVLRDGVLLRFSGASRLDDAVAALGRLAGR